MKAKVRLSQAVVLAIATGVLAANAHAETPCFKVGGNTVTVMNLAAKNGEAHDIDVEHMSGASSMVSSGSIAHNIQISNIKRDEAKNVTSFDATIDDTAYQYPKDACK
jgi:hypothetical protein